MPERHDLCAVRRVLVQVRTAQFMLHKLHPPYGWMVASATNAVQRVPHRNQGLRYRMRRLPPLTAIEAFVHDRLPWLAVMWHPEREASLVPSDLALIGHFLQGETI